MVKLTAILILKRNGEVNDPHMCGLASDLTQFGYFERPVVRDMLNFVSRTIVKRNTFLRSAVMFRSSRYRARWLAHKKGSAS